MDRITAAAFGFYAGLYLLGWVFCLFCFPETAGLTLEDAQLVLEEGFGVAEIGGNVNSPFRMFSVRGWVLSSYNFCVVESVLWSMFTLI